MEIILNKKIYFVPKTVFFHFECRNFSTNLYVYLNIFKYFLLIQTMPFLQWQKHYDSKVKKYLIRNEMNSNLYHFNIKCDNSANY